MRVYALLICIAAFWKHTSDKPVKFMVEYSGKVWALLRKR